MKASLFFNNDGAELVTTSGSTQQLFDIMRRHLRRIWGMTRTTSIVFVRLDAQSQLAGYKSYMVYVSGSPVQHVRIMWEGITYFPMDEEEREVAIPYVENPDEVE